MSLLTSAFTNQHVLFTKTFRMVVYSIRSHITHTSQLLCRYVWILQYQTQNLFRSLFRSHHILRLPNGRIHHKLILPVLRCCSILPPLQAHYSSPRRDRPPPRTSIVRLSDNYHIIRRITSSYYSTTYTFNRTKSDNYLTLYFVEGPSPYFSDRPNFTIISKSFWTVPFEGFFSNTSI